MSLKEEGKVKAFRLKNFLNFCFGKFLKVTAKIFLMDRKKNHIPTYQGTQTLPLMSCMKKA